MVTTLGAASIPLIIFVTLCGWILCFLLAELSAMMPERTGGAPSYAYPAFRERWPGPVADHANGIAAWAYWLGWFPVAPLNMILASFYICDRFNLNTTAGFTPIDTFIAWWTLAIAAVGILLFFIPSYLGIRIGAGFATVLGLVSMIPLTFLAVIWIFTGNFDFGNVTSFHHLDGSELLQLLQWPWLDLRLPRLLVPAHLERARDGGGRLLHRRMQGPCARREDRDDAGGLLRALHLHADPGRLRRRAGRNSALQP